MRRFPIKRVIFSLVLGFIAVGLHASYAPLTSAVPLPSPLQGKAVWFIERLDSGRLAVGFEGGVAFGYPNGKWTVVPTPAGQVARIISEFHGLTLIAGNGFAAFLDGETLASIPEMSGEYFCTEPVDQGWLVAGGGGAWLVRKDRSATQIASLSEIGSQARITRINGDVVLSIPRQPPRFWVNGELLPYPEKPDLAKQQTGWLSRNFRITNFGLTDSEGHLFLPPELNSRILKAGIVGLAESGRWVLVPTFTDGIYAIDFHTKAIAWTWPAPGGAYYFSRDGDSFLIGTGSGAIVFSNPWRNLYGKIDHQNIVGLVATDSDAVKIITSSGVIATETGFDPDPESQWPGQNFAEVRNAQLKFAGHSVGLNSRFVNGLAVINDTAAAALDQGLHLLKSSGTPLHVPIAGVAGSLASDGQQFLVGTASQGVQAVSPEGKKHAPIGTGRAGVREVRPGKVVLMFWNGDIMDSNANFLGHISWGNPRDAALVQNRLALLVTRPDRDPVIGLLEDKHWRPLEIPGLAEIGAEKIAATDEFLFAAGPRGIIRVRLPLAPAAPPSPRLSWSVPMTGDRVKLDSAALDHVGLTVSAPELSPSPATFFRFKAEDSAWEEVRAGSSFQIPLGWGSTSVSVRAERNGMVSEEHFTLIRPWPWWLHPWAWPLHFMVLGALVLGLVRVRTRRLEHQKKELESRVAERTEQLRKASAIKEEFLASISHEIRNPLNGVVGICAMLADREVGPREKILVRTLGGCADQLRSMLDDILDFARIERGQISLTTTDFAAVALVEEAARAMDPELTSCALILPDTPIWLHGDSGKIRQIICNLISNALKYGVPREAGVEVRILSTGEGRTRLRFAVRNSGPTIPPEELNGLFESFQRGTQAGNTPGTGLGLSVSRRLAQAMGGMITAASKDGITEFALELNLANAHPPVHTTNLPAMISHALVIEDEDYNRMTLGHVLRQLGYTIDWAEDGHSALRLAAERQYDLVLTDWRLPDMPGDELCRRLIQLLPQPTPPVVAVTAYSLHEKLAEAKAAGMTGFVTKPVTREKLDRVIRGLSEGLRPKRSLDTRVAPATHDPLASLEDLAPSSTQLLIETTLKWKQVQALARLRDPRTASEAHGLRGLLRHAGEEAALEQIVALEQSADASDWQAVDRLLRFAEEEIEAARQRLRP